MALLFCGIFADNPAFPSLKKLHHCWWQRFFFVNPDYSIGPAHSSSVTRKVQLKFLWASSLLSSLFSLLFVTFFCQ
jgi:hypothetical protein